MPDVPLHNPTTASAAATASRLREDAASRKIWNNTVIQGDKISEYRYQIRKLMAKYPQYSVSEIMHLLATTLKPQK
jgi:hypothetical protein